MGSCCSCFGCSSSLISMDFVNLRPFSWHCCYFLGQFPQKGENDAQIKHFGGNDERQTSKKHRNDIKRHKILIICGPCQQVPTETLSSRPRRPDRQSQAGTRMGGLP